MRKPAALESSSHTLLAGHWHRTLTLTILVAVLAAGAPTTWGQVPSDAVAHYPLDGSAQDSVAGADGTEHNGVTYTQGVCGQAASFDGVNDYIDLPGQALGDFTVSAWFKAGATRTWQRVWDFGSGANGAGGSFFLAPNHGRRGNQIGLGIHSSDAALRQDLGSGTVPALGTWYHVVVTYDKGGAGSTIYVDGVQRGTGTYNAQSFEDFGPASWYLGRSHWNDPLLLGSIDEVRIYNRVLSSAEVASLADPVTACNLDSDGDGINDDEDNCPDDANADQADLDEDGLGDVCDPDADGDEDPATSDCDDLDPGRYNGAEEICNDGIDNDCDGLVDLDDDDGDCDGDGVPNDGDNCPDDFNPYQDDLDQDGLGDVCDADDDGDTVPDLEDNCPVTANPGQEDFDGDGAGDACDDDGDGDGVPDFGGDQCHFTAPTDPDAGVPSRSLGKNRWADLDGDVQFDTNGKNPTGRVFSIYSTGGCSCAQIIEICGYGNGHTKFGCSNSVMDWWTGLYDRAGEAPFQCKDD